MERDFYGPNNRVVVLGPKRGRALLRVMGVRSKFSLTKIMDKVILKANDEVEIVYRDVRGLYKLVTVFFLVVLLALHVDATVDVMKGLADKITSEVTLLMHNPTENKPADGGYLHINSDHPGITLTNDDSTGIEAGYAVWVDGKLFEEVDRTCGPSYELILGGRLEKGVHFLRVTTYYYRADEEEFFDTYDKDIDIYIE